MDEGLRPHHRRSPGLGAGALLLSLAQPEGFLLAKWAGALGQQLQATLLRGTLEVSLGLESSITPTESQLFYPRTLIRKKKIYTPFSTYTHIIKLYVFLLFMTYTMKQKNGNKKEEMVK